MKKYIVTFVDFGDSSDCKPTIVCICNTLEEAKAYVQNDINDYIDNRTFVDPNNGETYCDYIADYDKMSVKSKFMFDIPRGSEWNIECKIID